MSADELRVIGEALYGQNWKDQLAADLAVSGRTMRYWMNGRKIPESAKDALAAIVVRRRAILAAL